MPNNIHRAPRQPIHGTQLARQAGAAAGFALGALAGADEVAASAPAVRLLPTGLANHLVPGLQKTAGLTAPLRAACKWSAACVVKVAPVAGYAVYWPSKVADVVAASYGTLVDQVPWANEQSLALRPPYAAYPENCDWQLPELTCPAPGGYARAAQLAPFMYTVAAVAVGSMLACQLAPSLWTLSAPTLALLPADGLPFVPSPYRGAVTSLGQHARRTTLALAQARAADRAQGAEAARPAPAAAQHLADEGQVEEAPDADHAVDNERTRLLVLG